MEKARASKLVSLGCIVCRLHYEVYSPPEIHHLKEGKMGKKAEDNRTIGLCPIHHRLSSTESFHLARKSFTERFGTQEELLEKTDNLIETQL